ncbi:hypothetical protein [Nonomuraea roseoviolacea]|uniref:hypothetical protein n=1 Tax=Nonomuraea roseoviolacea TaxID=103837 RepID=UPI0031DB86D3
MGTGDAWIAGEESSCGDGVEASGVPVGCAALMVVAGVPGGARDGQGPGTGSPPPLGQGRCVRVRLGEGLGVT